MDHHIKKALEIAGKTPENLLECVSIFEKNMKLIQ